MREKILRTLRESAGCVSGEELSRSLGVSRAAVWKVVGELRAEGYGIEAWPRTGYRLVSSPDRLIPSEILDGLKSRVMGREVRCFDSLPSTMDEAFRWAMDGAPQGALVCAETQTQGRGRLGRSWTSPRGRGIYCSLLVHTDFPPGEAARLTLLTAVALAEACERVSGVAPGIKWPNDLMLCGRKLAGILTELRAEQDRTRYVVIGIGINVNTPAGMLPEGAVSLREVCKSRLDRAGLLREFLQLFEEHFLSIPSRGWQPVWDAWQRRSIMTGRRVRFEERGRVFEGIAQGLDQGGGLIVRLAEGREVTRISGDVFLNGNGD